MLEDPKPEDPKLAPPLVVATCFDGLEIRVNGALLEVMKSHLKTREDAANCKEDTDFDRWLHGQVCRLEYNNV